MFKKAKQRTTYFFISFKVKKTTSEEGSNKGLKNPFYLRSSVESKEADKQEASTEPGQRNGMSGHVVEGSVLVEPAFSGTNDDARNLSPN